ncbi:MAG TPA: NAD(P)-dependent oxidoreductase [Vicinamibacterales bacterium]|nr:NAD(P)-dependent oxidoreductase [Vicinamibacterales bacterium]
MRVGIAGIGRMGDAMARRLLGAGCQVLAWNRTRDRMQPLVDAGADAAVDLPDLAARADAVLTIVTDDAAVEAVYRGPSGLLSGDVRGRIFADMSTILPDTVRRLAAAAAGAGAAFVDAPVAGTVAPAREGRLLILAGGDPGDVARLAPVFDLLGRRTDHVGPVGSGAAMKLVINTLLATHWAVLAEAMGMGSRYGLDYRRMLEVIGASPAAFAALPVKLPRLLGEPADIGFDITNVRKDLRTIARFADALEAPIRVARAALDDYQTAVDRGFGDRDVADIVRFMRE